MKRINANFNQNDRVICRADNSGHTLYYKPVGSSERVFLFSTDRFSQSVELYFRANGVSEEDGYSMTVAEIYDFKGYYNKCLLKTIERIPQFISYVIRYCIEEKVPNEHENVTYRRWKESCRVEDYDYEIAS